MTLTADELQHSALVDEISASLEAQIEPHGTIVRSAVLAILLARYLADHPLGLRRALFLDHVALVDGLLELFEHQAAGRQAN